MSNNSSFNLKLPNQGLEITHDDGSRSTLRIASAKQDNALRGPDPNLCLVDETFSIDEIRIPTIMALGHRKHCPILFFTSPNKNRMINFFLGPKIDFVLEYYTCFDFFFAQIRCIQNIAILKRLVLSCHFTFPNI